MKISNSALSWAAARSGMGFGEFLASLTPEKESALQEDYNAWRASKGLKPVEATAPITPPAVEKRPEVRPASQVVDSADAADQISSMMESIADEIEEQAIEDAEAVSRTMEEIDSMEVEDVPAQIEEEIEEEIGEIAPEEDANQPAPAPDAPAEASAPAAPVTLSTLPKEPDQQVYENLLAGFADIAAAIDSVKATIADHTRRHRGTAALRAFLKWLEDIPR